MNKNVDEIVAEVLRQNLELLKTKPQVYETVMLTYGNLFWNKLEDSAQAVSVGLKIGLTKHFLEFSLKNVCDYTDVKNLESCFKKISPISIQTALDSIESNALVYVTYRNLKKSIDTVFEEIGVK